MACSSRSQICFSTSSFLEQGVLLEGFFKDVTWTESMLASASFTMV